MLSIETGRYFIRVREDYLNVLVSLNLVMESNKPNKEERVGMEIDWKIWREGMNLIPMGKVATATN